MTYNSLSNEYALNGQYVFDACPYNQIHGKQQCVYESRNT